jgi:hypothetical protein
MVAATVVETDAGAAATDGAALVAAVVPTAKPAAASATALSLTTRFIRSSQVQVGNGPTASRKPAGVGTS